MDRLILIHENCGGELFAIGTRPQHINGHTIMFDYYHCDKCGELIMEESDPESEENALVFHLMPLL